MRNAHLKTQDPKLRTQASSLKTQVSRLKTRPAGFTIVELMVAILIALFIFSAGFMTIQGTIRARGEATARIHAAENARLFFQLLERDMAAAWAGPGDLIQDRSDFNSYGSPYTVVVGQENVPYENPRLSSEPPSFTPIATDLIQFYTRADIRSQSSPSLGPDRNVLVRYYVNTKEHTLCREVLESDDPALLLEEPVPQTDITPDGHAVFEDVRQLLIYHREWRSETKQFLPLLTDTVEHPTPQKATHLLVKLVLRDRYAEERRKYDPARGPSWESAYPTFVKVIPIPECFR